MMKKALTMMMALVAVTSAALDMDRLRVKRKEIYEFTEKPGATRKGDEVTITFAVKDFCDVTVAIENESKKIVRYLGSGVLGDNAPVPFQKNSRKQTIRWDGKDEFGRYVDDKEGLTARVSLGLRARMERTLFWSPHQMGGDYSALMRSAPEGMYVFYRGIAPRLVLYDHDGNYMRTVYPFPRDKIDKVKGLKWQTFPPDNERLPSKLGSHDQMTFLKDFDWVHRGREALTMAMDVRNGRICLAGSRLFVLATDGSTGGMNLVGPELWYRMKEKGSDLYLPDSVALSPDGKRAYLTGYMVNFTKAKNAKAAPHRSWYHLVNVVDLETGKITKFAGNEEAGKAPDNTRFCCPMSVACDEKGRVYVADNVNNRVQVFEPDGSYFKTIPVTRPGIVRVSPKTGDIFVRSSDLAIVGKHEAKFGGRKWGNNQNKISKKSPPRLTVFGPVENPVKKSEYGMETFYQWRRGLRCFDERVEIDFYADKPMLWASHVGGEKSYHTRSMIRMLRPKAKTLTLYRDFDQHAARSVGRSRPWRFTRPRMAVSPTTGLLYMGPMQWQAATFDPCFHEVIVVDPETGLNRVEGLPTDPEDMAFDSEGRIYLRTYNAITRFDPRGWREIPFDYGEERLVHHGGNSPKRYRAISALMLPSGGKGGIHIGGMGISPQGNIVAACINPANPDEKSRLKDKELQDDTKGAAYLPPIYPGRVDGGRRGQELHMFDIHGKVIKRDAAPGLNSCRDVELDQDGDVYVLASGTPYLDGKAYFNGRGCTLMKVQPGKMKGLAIENARIPLVEANRPKRSLDMTRPGLWIDGAEWLFGPVGADGHYGSGGLCHCSVTGWFTLDYFKRSFAPEVDRFRVVVLDANGNVIMRIGKYGNVDDGMPLVKPDPSRRGKQGVQPMNPRSIGGDEVGIMHAQGTAVHHDKRLFIADGGSQCVRSVKLDYHVEEKVPLSGVPDQEK